MTQEPFFTTLKNRAHIKISGKDSREFLQGLITNDIHLLDKQDCVYACLLTPQGKFLYDVFITENTENDDILTLDCEGGERATALTKLLNMYKLRADVTIEATDNIPVYAIFREKIGVKDPRHEDIGYRSFEKPENLPEKPFEEWDKHRIKLTIPDGSRDLIPQKSTMDEGRMDQLNAISYDKGCYIGQELTARMHYRGLGKKHLATISIPRHPEQSDGSYSALLIDPSTSSLPQNDKNIIEIRSSCGDIGIALMRS